MNREFWIDGFNFFHHWDGTKALLRPDSGYDIVRALARATQILGRRLGRKAGYSVLYLDGGLDRREGRMGGMRVRYCGPGGKADDRLADDLYDLGDDAKMITAVSNDRELKGRMRSLGASCLGVGEFLALIEGREKSAQNAKNGKKGRRAPASPPAGELADVLRQKTRTLSEYEVNAWLEYFGGDVEAEVLP